jgi:D-specific alpha-keto acid dehydrogenase
MTYSEPARTAVCRTRSLAPASSPAVPATGITVYGCGLDEAVLFREMAPRLGVLPAITGAAVSEANIELVSGNRCISVGHKTQIADSALLALSQAGVEYISTRSIGYDHINVEYAESVGLTVGNVSYSPGSVADYTLMLMLMAVRNAKSVILSIMNTSGFSSYDCEWWHYTLKGQPYPGTYFDFPIA